MSKNEIIQKHQEVSQARTVLDPRSFWKRVWDWFEKPWIPLAWALIALPIIVIQPAFIVPMMLVQLILWMAVGMNPDTLPIHLPMDAKKDDLNDPKPGDGNGYYKARGSFFIGRIIGTGIEVWASFKALTQHFLILGTTGSGKTESIVSYIVNYLAVGSGVAFQDAKAAPKAMIQMATFCRIFGRDDDFRVTNYITGNTSDKRDPAERLSNDAAVFARGSAESNTQLLIALLPPSEGDNKLFSERAIALVSAVMPALVDLRGQAKVQIDPAVIRKFMGFKQFCDLYRNNFISMRSRNAMLAYLESLPGFDEAKEVSKQPEEVSRQFGFAQAYFTRSLASLSDTYGHIYLTALGEIDYQDAVLNGRILMTLLPSMEKSGDELANLGKIVLTATRNGMVVGLGTAFEGSADDIVHNLPTNSDIPYGVMNDENAYMLVEGQEMINAQARGLGFGVMTGTQDAPGMLENISKTTKQIMANSAFKQIMYLDDKETTELAIEFSGDAQVMFRNRFNLKGDLGTMYADEGVTIERRKRLDSTAIKRQGLGQAFIMYQGRIHQTQVFNHGIQEKHKDPTMCYLGHWYSVRMPKVRLPDVEMMMELMELAPDIKEWQELAVMVSDDTRMMLSEMTTYFSSMLRINSISAAYRKSAGLMDILESVNGKEDDEDEDDSGLLDDSDSIVGVLAKVLEAPLKSYRDAPALLAQMSEDDSIAEVKLSKTAERVNLAMYDPNDDEDLFNPTDDDRDDGESGTGGMGNKPEQQAKTDVESSDSLLNMFLDESDALEPAGSTAREQATNDMGLDPNDQSATPQIESPVVPTSSMARAVERNLHNMPWMAGSVEYEQSYDALVETEMRFNSNELSAKTSIEQGLDFLGQQLVYPETDIKSAGLDIKTARDLLAPLLNKKG
ncbi:hypothetical protein LCGC14_0328150 [marine sediment metagenome]|uniref:TraD/TraG TraM recognition site domain-containing protein n=1 Tax=marine sediment metagenome TaxID=412755 RepID=A0A0F9W4L0_9ZZZZ